MSEFSRRILRPTVFPVASIVITAAIVLAFSRILLAVPEIGSTSLALLMASAVLLICGVIAAAGKLLSVQRGLLAVAALALFAGGGGAAMLGVRAIEKHAEEILIEAKGIEFNVDTLQFPQDQAVSLKFQNNDAGIPHNVTIAKDAGFSDILVQKPPFPGIASQAYEVEPLAAGVYFYRCDVHPAMAGTIVVGEETAAPESGGSPIAPLPSPQSTEGTDPGAEGAASTSFEISADQLKFSTDEIVLKAASDVVIVFENKESAPHNIAIHRNPDFSDEALFREDFEPGPKTFEYEFTSPEAGTYSFRCEVHPDMKGTARFR